NCRILWWPIRRACLSSNRFEASDPFVRAATARERAVAKSAPSRSLLGRTASNREVPSMHKPTRFLATGGLAALLLILAWLRRARTAGADKDDGWQALFNGKDLNGWDTWLGVPVGEKEQVGRNKDPRKVYTVVEVDGKPAIRISGEIFGALTSKQAHGDYHLKLEFKWGKKRWPPRETAVRDSGLLYHCVGPHGAAGTYWMRSQECQIQEHDCGDYWSVAGAIVDVEGERTNDRGPVVYRKGGKRYTVPSKESGGPRIVKSADHERPSGEWNTLELLTVGGARVPVVNSKVDMGLAGSRQGRYRQGGPPTRRPD